MADRTMVISWNGVVRGREERALDNFNDVVGMFGRMQQEGRIERLDVTFLTPNHGMDGFIQLQGSAEQMEALGEDQQFHRLMAEASLIVDDLAITEGYVNEGIAAQLAIFREAVAKVPQAA
jgi:hypothetical protein